MTQKKRLELRAEAEAAEARAREKGEKVPGEKAAKKAPAKRKSRAKAVVEKRVKVFWGVFDQAMRQKVLYDFSQRKAAEQKAAELSASGKNPHFVMKVKREVTEEA